MFSFTYYMCKHHLICLRCTYPCSICEYFRKNRHERYTFLTNCKDTTDQWSCFQKMIGLLLCVSNKERSSFLAWLYETFVMAIKKENERTGKRNLQIVFILDFEHFSMRQMASKPGNHSKLIICSLHSPTILYFQLSRGEHTWHDQTLFGQLPRSFPSVVYH